MSIPGYSSPVSSTFNPSAPPDRIDSDLWLEDGTLVLAAGEDYLSGRVLFRVHKSVLCVHSAVFRSLFGLTTSNQEYQDTGGDLEQYEGLPLLQVFDPAKDVKLLLEAIYKPG